MHKVLHKLLKFFDKFFITLKKSLMIDISIIYIYVFFLFFMEIIIDMTNFVNIAYGQ